MAAFTAASFAVWSLYGHRTRSLPKESPP